ncbi:MAG: ATP-binding cassette domain-containing protein, partial [Clostridia bacterium]|nr:ATP-binding cassette domain-containing protein [Clostridia bacterium]
HNINKILSEFNMLSIKNKQTDDLSAGEKQKLNITSTIVMNPEILILDEPTSMIDPESRKFIANSIKKIHKVAKTTMLLITHDIRDVLQADKLVVIEQGELVFWGSLAEFSTSEYTDNVITTDSIQILSFLEKSGYNVSKTKISVEECADEIVNLLEKRL